MERVHLDHLGPLPMTPEGYKHVLTMVCAFSLFPELVPVRSTGVQEVAEALFTNIFCRYGICKTIVTDRGSSFTSAVMQALCKLVGAKLVHTSSYKPCLLYTSDAADE